MAGCATFGACGRDRWAASSAERLARISAIDPAALPVVEGPVRFGPPIARPGKIICIGLNYTDHAAEVGLDVPTEPTIFMKGCVPTGANDPVRLPRDAEKGDWEVELGIIIGRDGLYIDEDDALAHVGGYCVVNDVSERSYQMEHGGQWTKGKSFPGFAPIGPWLVTPDEIADPGNLSIWLEVNGHRYQNSTTRNLVFSVAQMVSYVSRFYALEAGDLIATGTPAGGRPEAARFPEGWRRDEARYRWSGCAGTEGYRLGRLTGCPWCDGFIGTAGHSLSSLRVNDRPPVPERRCELRSRRGRHP
jgi:2-keto-4-pentenoate hydratase/2-oxohepta-3-ene-1,7-dioic acid hydratase in catechol pathway